MHVKFGESTMHLAGFVNNSPHNEAPEPEKIAHEELLCKRLHALPPSQRRIILGDFNGRVGSIPTRGIVAGRKGRIAAVCTCGTSPRSAT